MTDPIRLGIFGWPVAHSKSPQMHEAAARALGIALRYERFEVAPEGLAKAVRAKHAAVIDGYNVTVPHKVAIMSLIDEVAPAAQSIGAVNTVVRRGGRYLGHNTDALGFVRSLEEAGVQLSGARVVVLGAGGAARAAVVGAVSILGRRGRLWFGGGATWRSRPPLRGCQLARPGNERDPRVERRGPGVRRFSPNRSAAGGSRGRRHGLQAARDDPACTRERARFTHHRWPRDAAPSGRDRLRNVDRFRAASRCHAIGFERLIAQIKTQSLGSMGGEM